MQAAETSVCVALDDDRFVDRYVMQSAVVDPQTSVWPAIG